MNYTDLFKPSYLQSLCEQYRLRPSKEYGQNYLISESPLRVMLEAAELSPNDNVVEIGPGFGVLTFALAEKVKKVFSFEIEKKLEEYWQEVKPDNVEIIWGNVLYQMQNAKCRMQNFTNAELDKCKMQNVTNVKLKIKNENIETQNANVDILHSAFCIPKLYKVVANVPYQITSQLFRLFLEEVDTRPTCIVTMVQKEVAQRICASRGDMSLLAVSIQYYGTPKLVSYVSKGNFWPMPKVDSAVIKIDITKSKEPASVPMRIVTADGQARQAIDVVERLTPNAERDKYFFSVVKAAFAHKRKQAWRNIAEGLGLPSDVVKKVLKEVVGSESVRAQDVIVEEWRQIVRSIYCNSGL